MYEHALNVPLIMAGPGIPPDRRFAAQAYLRDIYPSVCEMTGVPIPASVEAQSLVSILSGLRQEIYPEVYAYWHPSGRSGESRSYQAEVPLQRMVRTERWKLIYYSHLDRYQLFDLLHDPHELRDLASDPAQRVMLDNLKRKMTAWFAPRIAPFNAAAPERSQ
jgi:arylsulfatase A-like enzyme